MKFINNEQRMEKIDLKSYRLVKFSVLFAVVMAVMFNLAAAPALALDLENGGITVSKDNVSTTTKNKTQRVIFTPKNYRADDYNTLTNREKNKINHNLWYYVTGDKLSWWSNQKKYAFLFTGFETVNKEAYGGLDYGIIVYYKDRGEKYRESDKKFIKELINGYDGLTCKALLCPLDYSYNDLNSVLDELNVVLNKYDRKGEIVREKISYKPLFSEDNKPVMIPEVIEFIKEHGYEKMVRTLEGDLPIKINPIG